MELEDKFAGMAYNKPIEIELDGETLELDVRVEDIIPLMSMGDQEGDIEQEDVETLTDTFRDILYRSYLPYYDEVRGKEPDNLSDARKQENEEVKEFINGILVRKLPELINKIVEELGWSEGAPDQDFPGKESLQR